MPKDRLGFLRSMRLSACLAALLSAALPAKALVLTYGAGAPNTGGGGLFDKSEATGNPNQSRPMQLPRTGQASQLSARNFIFDGLRTTDSAGPGLGSPIWTPVNQYGPENNSPNNPVSALLGPYMQRFDYTFDAADDTSGAPDRYKWNNTFKLISFGTFYLDGACSFCGADKPVSILETLPAYSGSARYEANGQIDASDPWGSGSNFYLAGNFYDSNVFNIRFGSTDITGTLQFKATSATVFTDSGGNQISWGQIFLNINESATVPIDLPSTTVLLAAGIAGIIGIQRRRRLWHTHPTA